VGAGVVVEAVARVLAASSLATVSLHNLRQMRSVGHLHPKLSP